MQQAYSGSCSVHISLWYLSLPNHSPMFHHALLLTGSFLSSFPFQGASSDPSTHNTQGLCTHPLMTQRIFGYGLQRDSYVSVAPKFMISKNVKLPSLLTCVDAYTFVHNPALSHVLAYSSLTFTFL